jgi:hypothetical protein
MIHNEREIQGHLEKYRFTPEAPIETHVLTGVGLGQWSRQSRFFEVASRTFWGRENSGQALTITGPSKYRSTPTALLKNIYR